jgi:hypothetical protein
LLGVLVVIAAVTVASGASAPSAPSITAKPANPTNVPGTSFSFTGTAGATFECALDTATFTPCASPKSYGSLAAGSHTFQVRAVSDGKTSSATSYSWLIDVTAPARPVVTAGPTPLPGWSTQASSQFSFTGEAGASFLCSFDGAADVACASGVAYTVSQQVTHTFSVKAKDAAGNVSAASTPIYQWKVDSVAPAAPTLTDKPDDPNGSAISTFTWSASEANLSYQCSIENGAFQACTSPFTFTVIVDTNSNQQHQFAVRATDQAGNVSAATTYKWKVDKSVGFTISGNATTPLYPLNMASPPQPLNLTITNPNNFSIKITTLTVTVQAVTKAAGAPAGPCTASDYKVSNYTGSSFIAPPGTTTLSADGVPPAQRPTVGMLNRHDAVPGDGSGNQNGCKGATVQLAYGGTATK